MKKKPAASAANTEREVSIVKKHTILICISFFLLTLCVLTAAADEPEIIASGICGRNYFDPTARLDWELNDAGTLRIHGNCAMYDFDPQSPAEWFAYYDQITNVVIEEGAKSIGARAFSYCENIRSVSIADSVTTIGEAAFEGCRGLDAISFTRFIESVGDHAFQDCSNLKAVHIPDTDAWCGISFGPEASNPLQGGALLYVDGQPVTEVTVQYHVSAYAFCGYTALTSVRFADHVDMIGEGAFLNCTGLTELVLPSGLRSIAERTFEGCTNLKNINIPKSVEYINYNAFCNCSSLTELVLPDNCQLDSPFQGCTGLKRVVLPNGPAFVPYGAFSGCSSLESVTLADSTTHIEMSAFENCTALKAITIPQNVEFIGDDAFGNCTDLKIVQFLGIPDTINSNAFRECAIWHVLFPGTQAQWNALMSKVDYNVLRTATVHFNCTGDELVDPVSGKCSLCAELCGDHVWDNGTIIQQPNCLHGGYVTYACTNCQFPRTEYLEKLTEHSFDNDCDAHCNVCGLTRTTAHYYDEQWHRDETYHWQECPYCKEKDPHSYGQHLPGVVTETDTFCAGCGYLMSSLTEPTTEPSIESSTEPIQPNDTQDGSYTWIILAAAIILLGGVAGILLWKKKH